MSSILKVPEEACIAYPMLLAKYSSLALSVITLITFSFAMIAVPASGPFCPGSCMSYPFEGLLEYYPRDYYWMYLAIVQLFVFIIFIVSCHNAAAPSRRVFSSISVAFAIISSATLLIAYFTQFSVVPVSVMHGEKDGIALITQYNDHGLFIAMEELGYITMSIALLFLAPVFNAKTGLEMSIRVTLAAQFVLSLLAFIFITVKHGVHRSYIFEVAIISICWLSIIAVGLLAGLAYHKRKKASTEKNKLLI